ncbi:MAG: pyridoxamine 5'-phosphate oxidase family protein [Chthoniobacterales bacterium]
MEPAFDYTELESADGLIAFTQQLMNGERPGVLTTMGPDGYPHARWMGTLSLEEFPRLYALTSPSSLKVFHVHTHPHVEWMFTNEDQAIVLNLKGTACIYSEIRDMKRIWRMISDKSKAYFLDSFTKGAGFCVIETVLSGIECNIPKNDRRISVEVDADGVLSPGKVTSLFSAPAEPAIILKPQI